MELSHNLLVNTKAFLVLVDVSVNNRVIFKSIMPIIPQSDLSNISFTDILRLHAHHLLGAAKVRSVTRDQYDLLINGMKVEIDNREYKLVIAAREEAVRLSKQRGLNHPELLCGDKSNCLSNTCLHQTMSTVMTAHYESDFITQVPVHYDLEGVCDLDGDEYEVVVGIDGGFSVAIHPFFGFTDPIATNFTPNRQPSFDVGFFGNSYRPMEHAREGRYSQLRSVDEMFYEVDGEEDDLLIESLRYDEILRYYPLQSFFRDLREYFHGNV